MDEMMRGQRGWRELAILGDKMDKFSGMIEGFIWSPKGGEANDHSDDWTSEEVLINNLLILCTNKQCFWLFFFFSRLLAIFSAI